MLNANNTAALEMFIAAAGAFFGLAPQKLLVSTRATPPETGADLAAMAEEANTAAAQQCAANGDPPPVTFETSAIGGDPSGYSAPVSGITRIRYGGGRTFAQIEIVGDLWLFSIGVREHSRVTVDSALSLARSIAARTACAATVKVPAEPEGVTVVRRSPLPEDATS